MSELRINGSPVFSANFYDVPSRNARKSSWKAQMGITAEWRFEAREKALNFRGFQWDEGFFAQLNPLIVECALVVVTVYLHSNGIADVHNPDIKPILDGFTDAGIYTDDEWAFVPLVLFAWGGIRPQGKKLRIDVYELEKYVTNNWIQPLPAGRIVIDERLNGTRKTRKHTKAGPNSRTKNSRKRA